MVGFKTDKPSGELRSLEEHNKKALAFYRLKRADTGIACPECGEELTDTNPYITLHGFPPQKLVHCDKCKWFGARFV